MRLESSVLINIELHALNMMNAVAISWLPTYLFPVLRVYSFRHFM